MIKLFWNTHNQIEINSSITKDQLAVNISWGNYHKKNSDKWIFEVLSKLKFKIINDIAEIENEDILIIVDSSIENMLCRSFNKKAPFPERLVFERTMSSSFTLNKKVSSEPKGINNPFLSEMFE